MLNELITATVIAVGVTNPAVTQGTTDITICKIGWTKTVRPPANYTNSVKRKLMTEQHLTGSVRDYELDHAIPLELGGHPTSLDNLWMQPWSEARQKDKQESRLKRAVCAGRMTLKQAQDEMRRVWLTK